MFPIFLALEDAWFVQTRVLFLLRRAAITACCTGNAPSKQFSFAFDFSPFSYHVIHYSTLQFISASSRRFLSLGVAYLAQNSFAYVGAINGSVGCALLLFVIPCAIDLKLSQHDTVRHPPAAAQPLLPPFSSRVHCRAVCFGGDA